MLHFFKQQILFVWVIIWLLPNLSGLLLMNFYKKKRKKLKKGKKSKQKRKKIFLQHTTKIWDVLTRKKRRIFLPLLHPTSTDPCGPIEMCPIEGPTLPACPGDTLPTCHVPANIRRVPSANLSYVVHPPHLFSDVSVPH